VTPPIGGLVELEVDGPDVVRVFGSMAKGRLRPDPSTLPTDLGTLQAFFAPTGAERFRLIVTSHCGGRRGPSSSPSGGGPWPADAAGG